MLVGKRSSLMCGGLWGTIRILLFGISVIRIKDPPSRLENSLCQRWESGDQKQYVFLRLVFANSCPGIVQLLIWLSVWVMNTSHMRDKVQFRHKCEAQREYFRFQPWSFSNAGDRGSNTVRFCWICHLCQSVDEHPGTQWILDVRRESDNSRLALVVL